MFEVTKHKDIELLNQRVRSIGELNEPAFALIKWEVREKGFKSKKAYNTRIHYRIGEYTGRSETGEYLFVDCEGVEFQFPDSGNYWEEWVEDSKIEVEDLCESIGMSPEDYTEEEGEFKYLIEYKYTMCELIRINTKVVIDAGFTHD